VAPYFDPNIALNINACVFPDGNVTLHAPSVQLIGIACCTSRRFGYCGNDFARIRHLERGILDSLEVIALRVGKWLHSKGYLGAFGVDAMVHEGQVYLTEVNPRFQGSSAVAARLAAGMDLPDIFNDHMAAFLGLDAPQPTHVRDLAREQDSVAQIVCYNSRPIPVVRRSSESLDEDPLKPELLPAPELEVEPEGTLFKVVVEGPVTRDGHSLLGGYLGSLESLVSKLFMPTGAVAQEQQTQRPT
jgi:hypothetical protein